MEVGGQVPIGVTLFPVDLKKKKKKLVRLSHLLFMALGLAEVMSDASCSITSVVAVAGLAEVMLDASCSITSVVAVEIL